jgi:type II restriction/modification system DNA methylase subunit YeeA
LNSYARSSDTAVTEQKLIQFDQTELQFAAPFNAFPDVYDESIKFYNIIDGGLREIDWSSMALADINSLNEDVYKLESDNSLTLQTTYFEKYHIYYVKS